MSLKYNELDRAFLKLQMEIRDGGDKFAWFTYDGKRILFTKVSHGSGTIKGNIPHFIRQQLKLNENQFRLLIACPLTREAYIEILKTKKII